jgi:hypothetical protein
MQDMADIDYILDTIEVKHEAKAISKNRFVER